MSMDIKLFARFCEFKKSPLPQGSAASADAAQFDESTTLQSKTSNRGICRGCLAVFHVLHQLQDAAASSLVLKNAIYSISMYSSAPSAVGIFPSLPA